MLPQFLPRQVRFKYEAKYHNTVTSTQAMKNRLPHAGSSPAIKVLNLELTYSNAQAHAQDMGSRLPTLKEFILALREHPKLYEQSKSGVYWLSGEPEANVSGFCSIDYEKGTLIPVSEDEWKKLPDSERAYVSEGRGHMVLYIFSGDGVGRLAVGALGDDAVAGVALILPLKNPSASMMHESTSGMSKFVNAAADRIAEAVYVLFRK